MKKVLILSLGALFLISGLCIREWLLHQEISVTETQLKEQATTALQSASSVDRVRHLTTSTVVYERYLSPVIEISNRLLWTPSRSEVISDWKREMHSLVDDLAANRRDVLSKDAVDQIQKIRSEAKPGLPRLYDILKAAENTADLSCSQTVRDEMKTLSEAGQKRDQEILAAMKVEGLTQLKHLDKAIKGMGSAQIGNFLKSGRFLREIQQPILNYVLQIKQEELRKSAWTEFQKKIEAALSHKSVPVASVKDRSQRAKKEIEKLFNSMAEAKTGDLLNTHEPEAAPSQIPSAAPSQESLPSPELTSPSDANAL